MTMFLMFNTVMLLVFKQLIIREWETDIIRDYKDYLT